MNRELISHLIGMPFTLIAAHALADFPLQGQFLADYKNPTRKDNLDIRWWWIMFMHCMIHAVFVYLFTGSLILGCFELIAHFAIDYIRCLGYLSFMEDQQAHIVSKLVWCMLLLVWRGIV